MSRRRNLPEFNGLSLSSITIDQSGEVTVQFDLPVRQRSHGKYLLELGAVRTIDLDREPKLRRLARELFRAVRRSVERPDPERKGIDCRRCRSAPCCRNYNVYLTDADIDRLRGSMSRSAFLARHACKAADWTGDYRYQLRCDEDEDGEKCIFLRRDAQGWMRCSVYARRPKICRDFDMASCDDFDRGDGKG
ncbi:MAG: YkgJ family cysteine cluster protein [Planctomycetes bacterium]|nr:YkgJ family cysteine cluster protein [Planctomycetota bacterium]